MFLYWYAQYIGKRGYRINKEKKIIQKQLKHWWETKTILINRSNIHTTYCVCLWKWLLYTQYTHTSITLHGTNTYAYTKHTHTHTIWWSAIERKRVKRKINCLRIGCSTAYVYMYGRFACIIKWSKLSGRYCSTILCICERWINRMECKEKTGTCVTEETIAK